MHADVTRPIESHLFETFLGNKPNRPGTVPKIPPVPNCHRPSINQYETRRVVELKVVAIGLDRAMKFFPQLFAVFKRAQSHACDHGLRFLLKISPAFSYPKSTKNMSP